MKKKIITEVTVQEMLRLREEYGLSNSEIAERLEISDLTVRKHIGCNPKGIRRVYRSKRTEEPIASSPLLQDTEKEPLLAEIKRHHSVILGGKFFMYEADLIEKTVALRVGDVNISKPLNQETLERFIAELIDLMDFIK